VRALALIAGCLAAACGPLGAGAPEAQPTATVRFTPEPAATPTPRVGLPSPLTGRGEWTFTLTGKLTIREIERPSTWSVVARRDGATITATATTEFGFEEYSIERPSQVLSLQDKIRLEIKLVAKQT